jgi:hypothetical protein
LKIKVKDPYFEENIQVFAAKLSAHTSGTERPPLSWSSRAWKYAQGKLHGPALAPGVVTVARPAHDLGRRLAHWALPIPGTGGSDFRYAWIPVVAPVVGGTLAAFLYLWIGF